MQLFTTMNMEGKGLGFFLPLKLSSHPLVLLLPFLSHSLQCSNPMLLFSATDLTNGTGKFGFLDSYSGDTSKPRVVAEVCRQPEKTCQPQLQPSTPPFTPLRLLLCWALRRRRNGGRWVCGWGRCGAKSCLIAALHGLHHFHQRLSLTSLPGQHVLP